MAHHCLDRRIKLEIERERVVDHDMRFFVVRALVTLSARKLYNKRDFAPRGSRSIEKRQKADVNRRMALLLAFCSCSGADEVRSEEMKIAAGSVTSVFH